MLRRAFEESGAEALASMQRYNKEKAEGTFEQGPTETFETEAVFEYGEFQNEVRVLWVPAHSPGDIVVWLPRQKLVISGDMAFHERLLPVFEDTDTAGWLESWKAFEALCALYVIPGHGHPTNMAQVRRYTRDYLVFSASTNPRRFWNQAAACRRPTWLIRVLMRTLILSTNWPPAMPAGFSNKWSSSSC